LVGLRYVIVRKEGFNLLQICLRAETEKRNLATLNGATEIRGSSAGAKVADGRGPTKRGGTRVACKEERTTSRVAAALTGKSA
jgi:hypothetical protein